MTSCTGCRCRRQGCTTRFGCGHRKAICSNCSPGSSEEGFAIYLTADHGNVTATGIGNPKEGVLVETKGQAGPGLRPSRFREEVASQVPGVDSLAEPRPAAGSARPAGRRSQGIHG